MPRVDPLAPLPALLHIAELGITVGDIATTDMRWIDGSETTVAAAAVMGEFGFDVMPIRGSSPRAYVELSDLGEEGGCVMDAAKIIDARHLVTSDLGLADGVMSLGEQPFFFVLHGKDLTGIVTWSDLQKPPVSMVVLGMILAAEAGLNQLILREYGADWLPRLTENRQERAKEVFRERQRRNTEISLLQCIMLEDRLALVGKNADLRGRLGFESRGAVKRWQDEILPLRNTLAHGGDLLLAEPDVGKAVSLFARVREFAEESWGRV